MSPNSPAPPHTQNESKVPQKSSLSKDIHRKAIITKISQQCKERATLKRQSLNIVNVNLGTKTMDMHNSEVTFKKDSVKFGC